MLERALDWAQRPLGAALGRRLADRLITLGKRADTHARRVAFSMLSDKENTEKLFAGIIEEGVGRGVFREVDPQMAAAANRITA